MRRERIESVNAVVARSAAARAADGAPRREPGDARPATCCNSCSNSKRRSRGCSSSRSTNDGSLRAMLDAASSSPVLDWRGDPAKRRDASARRSRARGHRALRAHAVDAGQRALRVLHADALLQQQAARCRRGRRLAEVERPASRYARTNSRRSSDARARADRRRTARLRRAVERALQL